MIGFLVFALPVVAVLAALTGEWTLALLLLGAAGLCLLLLRRYGATKP